LFLVPAVIVIAIVGVYFMVRQLVSSNQDWQSLVAELRSTNPHRRWRGAHGLAQMLQADAQRGDSGQQLARNTFIADELAGLMDEQLRSGSQNGDDISQRAFLARSLGWLDQIAQVAGRAADQRRPLEAQPLTGNVIAVSADPEPLVRQLSAYVLGLLPGDESRKHLVVLLEDADANTRANAAIGLARQQSPAGIDIFYEILGNAHATFEPTETDGDTPQERRQAAEERRFEHLVRLSNTLKAVADLAPEFSSEQRSQMLALVVPIADNHAETRVRLDAKQAARALEQ
jgi:hypothetical protein